MQRNPGGFYVLVALTLLPAYILAVFPLSTTLSMFRPEFVVLLVVYWVLYAPERVGVGVAWLIGLLTDIVEGTVWGGHAVAMAVIAYIGIHAYQRLRSYPLWQQALWAFVFLGIHQIIVSWVQGLEGYYYPVSLIVYPALIGACVWPPIVLAVQWLRRRTGWQTVD